MSVMEIIRLEKQVFILLINLFIQVNYYLETRLFFSFNAFKNAFFEPYFLQDCVCHKALH